MSDQTIHGLTRPLPSWPLRGNLCLSFGTLWSKPRVTMNSLRVVCFGLMTQMARYSSSWVPPKEFTKGTSTLHFLSFRISSHYPERFGETFPLHGYHRGYDLKGDDKFTKLPANKRTVLFFRLGDGTTVIKGEYAGCPPFWQRSHRTLSNAAEFGKHSVNFLTTRFQPAPGKIDVFRGWYTGMPVQRSEFVPGDLHRYFLLALDVLYPKDKLSDTPGVMFDEVNTTNDSYNMY